VKKVTECPSPDGAWRAVVWAETSGGAAGSFNYLVSLHAKAASGVHIGEDRVAPEEVIMRVSNAEGMDFRWEGNDTLIVSGSFPKRASLNLQVGFPLLNPQIRIIYRDLQPVTTSALDFAAGSMSCESSLPRRTVVK